MGRKRQLPLDEIRAKYECQGYEEEVTISELADEYDCSKHYLYKLSSENNEKPFPEGWEKGKYKDDVEEAVKEDIIKDAKEKEKELREKYNAILDYLFEKVKDEIEGEDRKLKHMKFYRKAMSTIKELRSEHWEVNRIEEFNQQIKQQFNQMQAKQNSVEFSIDDYQKFMKDEKNIEKAAEIAKNQMDLVQNAKE